MEDDTGANCNEISECRTGSTQLSPDNPLWDIFLDAFHHGHYKGVPLLTKHGEDDIVIGEVGDMSVADVTDEIAIEWNVLDTSAATELLPNGPNPDSTLVVKYNYGLGCEMHQFEGLVSIELISPGVE